MKTQVSSVAGRFASYSHLGWLGRWYFRHFLKWVSNDEFCVQLLLNFEQKIWRGDLSSKRVSKIIVHALTWYNQEDHDERIVDRLPHNKLPDLLQIVLFFLEKKEFLDYSYRDLFIKIFKAIEDFAKQSSKNSKIRPDQFRLEVMNFFSSITSHWGNWYPSQSSFVDHILVYLRDIANRVSNMHMFTQFRLEAQKESLYGSLYQIEQVLSCLRDLADKVMDEQAFTHVFSDFVPKIGLRPTSGLMRSSVTLQEFESNYQRVFVAVERWRPDYINLFSQVNNVNELEQLLNFLNSLSEHTRMGRYHHYEQSHHKGALSEIVSGALLTYKVSVHAACVKQDWKRPSEFDLIMDSLINEFECHIVNTYLGTEWYTKYYSRGIRWEFDKFTEYIPYEINNRNWAEDNEKNRPYWNATKFQEMERNRFISELQPRLCFVLKKLSLADFEILLVLLPSGFLIQEFTKEVDVPVEWEQGVEYQEGYNKWAGNYTEEIIVARPTAHAKHIFTFERPNIQNTVSLLGDMGKIHHAIQEYKRHQP